MKASKVLALFMCVITVVSHVQTVQAGSFFGRFLKERQPDVVVDERGVVRAPFYSPEESYSKKVEKLDRPHRDAKTMSEWITSVFSMAMTFQTIDFESEIKQIHRYFDDAGHAQFIAFLKSKNIHDVYGTHGLYMYSAVIGTPVLLNEAVTNGAYHWLYDVPFIVTYMTPDNDYSNISSTDTRNTQKITIRAQVGRTDKKDAREGLVIETWKVVERGMDKL